MFALLKLLRRSAGRTFASSIVFSMLAGVTNAVVLASINSALHAERDLGVRRYLGLCLLALLASLSAEALLLRMSQDLLVQIRLELSRKILRAPLPRLEQIGAAPLLAVLTDDVTAIANAATALPAIITAISVVTACFGYLAYLSIRGFTYTVALLAFGLATYYLLCIPANRGYRRARDHRDRLFRHLRSLVEGAKELKLNAAKRETFVDEGLAASALAVRRSTLFGTFFLFAAANWGYTLFFLAIGVFLFAGPTLGVHDSILSGYVLTILYMRSALELALSLMPIVATAGASLAKLESIGVSIEEDKGARGQEDPSEPRRHWQSLQLSEICHTYYREDANSGFRLGPVSLTLEPGKVVFLVGGNGSGKSTLAKLITGLYAPESGEILLDDTPIDDSNREWYRQHFSAVFSDYHLFETNHGQPADDAKAAAYLKALRLDSKVKIEGGTFSTTALSSGQRKRLALLVAYIEDRPIYVFDEWTSDQDPIFKRIFYTDILPSLKAKRKAVLVITHDDRYFALADVRIKLEDGQIADDSTSEFMARMR